MHPQLQRCYDLAIKGAWSHPFFLIPLGHCTWHEGNPEITKTMAMAPIVKGDKIDLNLYINTQWVAGLPDEEVFGVLCHEIMHAMLRHHERMGGKKKDLWNQAADMAINSALVQSEIKLPAAGLLPPREHFDDPAEDLYTLLDDGEIEQPKNYDPSKVGQGCSPEERNDGQESGDGQNGDGEGQGSRSGEGEGEGQGQGGGSGQSNDRAWGEMIAQAQSMGRGTGSAKVMAKIFAPKPVKTQWDKLLKRTANRAMATGGRDAQTFSKVNRRSMDIVLPGWQSNRPAITVIIDSSGSVSDEMLRAALTSAKQCAKTSGVRVFLALHDGRCYFADWINPETSVEKLSGLCTSRGGTDPREAFEKVSEARGRFDAGVYLTDGEVGQYPQKPGNVKRMIVGLLGDDRYSCRAKIPPGWQEVDVEIPKGE